MSVPGRAGRAGARRPRRLPAVLLASVLSAAFIGPGTVTTAAESGARYGLRLVWALVFSTAACIVLQEAAARLTIVSGRDLGETLVARAGGRGVRLAVVALVAGAVVLGCAAYEAGNILGGVAGAMLGIEAPRRTLTLLTGGIAAALLATGAPATVARWLGVLVAVMGGAFLLTAAAVGPAPRELLAGALVPRFPAGSGVLVLGLVGTTVVPYNLFLGSALARGQRLDELRFGLVVAIGLGGLISVAVVVAGSALEGGFHFAALADVLAARLGGWARSLFAAGLFAAGLSSAVTAPLAAALTARSLAAGGGGGSWSATGWRFRAVWAGVLATGVAFGLAGVRPAPAIVLAQALNGVVLPLVAVFLLLAVNDRALAGGRHINGAPGNLVLGAVVWVSVVLGLSGLTRALAAAAGLPRPPEWLPLTGAALLAAVLAWPVWRHVTLLRRG